MNQPKEPAPAPKDGIVKERRWWSTIPVSLWVAASFVILNITAAIIFVLLSKSGGPLYNIDANVEMTMFSAVLFAALLGMVLGVPRLLKLWSARISYRRLLGYTRPLWWRDILFALLGFIVYFAMLFIVMRALQTFVPVFNGNQAQDLGFTKTLTSANAVLVFLSLVVVAPIAEETIFRGYLFGTLRRAVPVWVAALITSLLFAAAHWQWNVSTDVFLMSLVSCFLRYKTGSLWASILLHMTKNALAFFVLYVATNSIV